MNLSKRMIFQQEKEETQESKGDQQVRKKMVKTKIIMMIMVEEEGFSNQLLKTSKAGLENVEKIHTQSPFTSMSDEKLIIYCQNSYLLNIFYLPFHPIHYGFNKFEINYIIIMLRSNLKYSKYLFGPKPKKPQIDNPTFKEKLHILNQLKPYIIPFLHKNKLITYSLLKSYGYLVLSKFCFFGGPMLLKHGINSLQNLTLGDPILFFLGYGVCYSASILFQSLRNIEVLNVTSLALTETSTKAYKHMLSLGPEFFFSGSQRTKLFSIYKAQSAIEQNIKSFTQYFLPFFLDVGICSTLLLYYADYSTMIAFISCYSIYSIFTIKYSQMRRSHVRDQRMAQRRLDFISSQTFANYYNVKYFKKQQHEVAKYQKALENYYACAKKAQQSLGILNTVQRIIFGAGITFNLIMGAYFVQKGVMSTGDVIMIQTLMLQFLSPLFFLGSTYRNFMDTFVEVKQLFDTMKKPAQVIEGTKQLAQVKGNISFKDVTFYYSEIAPVLKDFSFQINAGDFVGVIGESGAGKSTILNLIFRLFDPLKGQIYLDGQNLRDLKFSFRDHIVFVSQTPYLFNGTVMENLQYGHPESTREQVEYYTRALGIHDVIMELPKQYDSNVGQKGNIFSGGQKQRISLIRALLKRVPVILLDEPTSALDFHSQQKVIKILHEYKGTKIMITHRESLLKYVDKIIEVKKI